ncbi:hypothetical protein BCR32DRAFT_330610 [Anaeromyces robustus]|uniref:Uncharacterized protein n=1 Tax=Anaeromyces robustus TaxID=1754192 RepID=A0A1Y1VT29_9FUNG|nr:hypothetical protein BCR32DRAFT_330610 [Anaeromyces robustus]|eukprot:ORX64449.1 hypothetical protein BCR32DRAFT_330610 [Anaeromyces robustus]
MNFKTILSVFALAVVAVSANEGDIATLKKDCEADHKARFYINDKGEYTCLRQHPKEEDLDYRTCFFTDTSDTVLCVEESWNNIPSCSKNSGATDYNDCAYRFLKFVDREDSDKLSYRIRKFPTHEKIFYDYKLDQKECRGNDGIVLTNNVITNYVCLQKATPKNAKMLSDKECFMVDGVLRCVHQDNTSIELCNKRHKTYNHEACVKIVEEYGKVNGNEIVEHNF